MSLNLLFMKNIKFFLFTSFVFSISLIFSQGSTTLEEYNYIQSGIPTQKRTGQDVDKRGYTLEELETIEWTSGIIHEYVLLKREHDGSIAGIGFYSSTGRAFCIPFDNHELMWKYNEKIQQLSVEQAQHYALSLSYAFAKGMEELNQKLQTKQTKYLKLMYEARLADWASGELYKELEKYPASKEFLNDLKKKYQEKMDELERYGEIQNVYEK